MAEITFEAFVEPWTRNTEQHPAWGLKSAETHSKKNDEGKYETSGRTFRTVKVSRASGIDLTQFAKGDRIKVEGQEVTETREHDGKKYYDLVVWAKTVEVAERGQSQSQPSAPAGDVWANQPSDNPWPDSETPF